MGALVLLLGLAACGGPPPKVGEAGAVVGFLGAAISEEPRSALLARDVLSAGGSAADAVTTAYFAMAVTYPVAVGLGGGGFCLYYDHQGNKTETLDFRSEQPTAGGLIAAPGTLRGMALLHSRYGRLPWGQLVAPAENMARFGHQMSRALASRLQSQAARLRQDEAAAKIFLRDDGSSKREAETLLQVELASVLTGIRTRGVSSLYGGDVGRQFVQAANEQGGKLRIADLRQYRVVSRETARRELGNEILHHPLLGDGSNPAYDLTGAVLNKASTEPAAGSQSSSDRGDAAIVVADKFGSAVACVYRMNGAFGTGRMSPQLGMFLSPSPGAQAASRGDWTGYPLPLLGINENVNQAFMAVAASGGPQGAKNAATVAVALMNRDSSLSQAVAAADGQGQAAGGRVQAIWCPKGIRDGPETCRFATDRRGHGLAAFDKF